MRVVSVDEMRAIEQRAESEHGLDSPTLMEHAGRSVAEALRERLGGDVRGLRVVTLAGPGNNGGDGHQPADETRRGGADAHALAGRWRSGPHASVN